jgi:hypothetical protein
MAACTRALAASSQACIVPTASRAGKPEPRSSEAGRLASFALFQLILDAPELLQRNL